MDQIEKPLSILLILAAIAYVFMYTDASDGFTAIENNTSSGYNIESAEISTGYNVNGTSTCESEQVEIYSEDCELEIVDSLTQNIMDSLVLNIEDVELEVVTTDE